MHKLLLLLAFPFLFALACSPVGEVIVVPGNESPPDLTVPGVVQENFVNRVYISLLGRKPESQELNSALGQLSQANASASARKKVVLDVLRQRAYKDRLYNTARIDLLNNVDTAEIANFLFVFNQALQDPQYQSFIYLIEFEINRLEELSAAAPQFLRGDIDKAELHRRMVNNNLYDEINMGTQNFVLSVFEHFLNRYPTQAEEQQCILMVDGTNAIAFGKEGSSKEDFLDILLNSDAYLEGQVFDMYEALLFRVPLSAEMAEGTLRYRQTQAYDSVLTDILVTDEFLGW